MKGGPEKSIAPNAMWQKRPRGQIAKCAAAQALRIAFPEIASQPTAEEMEGKAVQADDAMQLPPQIPPGLLDAAQDAALGGVESLRAWWNAAPEENRAFLLAEFKSLKAAAKAADEKRTIDERTDADGVIDMPEAAE